MCGLFGMVGYLEHKHKAVLKDLMYLNTLRGKDSTGITAVKRDRMVVTRKMTVPGYEFMDMPLFERALTHGDQVWMGHGRWRTVGEINKSNAQPFEVMDDEGNVMLAGTHNGTLNNKWAIENRLKDKFETDSEGLFNLLADAPDFKEAIGLLRGAWSLVWWDPTTDSLHFCRNEERPLCYAWSKDHKQLLWASEAWMIINAARRNGLDLDKNDKGLSCYATIPDHLYTIEIPQGNDKERDRAIPDVKREGGYTGAPVGGFQGAYDGYNRFRSWWDRDELDEEGEKKPKKETESGSSNRTETRETVTLGYPNQGKIRGYNGETITLAEFDAIRDKGCMWCKSKFNKDEPFAFLSDEALVCLKCVNGSHPKGDCVRSGEDPLDDDLPFDPAFEEAQKDSPEYKRVLAAAATRAGSTTPR